MRDYPRYSINVKGKKFVLCFLPFVKHWVLYSVNDDYSSGPLKKINWSKSFEDSDLASEDAATLVQVLAYKYIINGDTSNRME